MEAESAHARRGGMNNAAASETIVRITMRTWGAGGRNPDRSPDKLTATAAASQTRRTMTTGLAEGEELIIPPIQKWFRGAVHHPPAGAEQNGIKGEVWNCIVPALPQQTNKNSHGPNEHAKPNQQSKVKCG